MTAIASFVRGGPFEKEKPFMYWGPPVDHPDTNMLKEERALNITDLRTLQGPKPGLDTHGFCYVNHVSKELDSVTPDQDCVPYAAEMAKYIKELLGATAVIPVQSTIRSSKQEEGMGLPGIDSHIDSTLENNWIRMTPFLSDKEQEEILDGKFRVRMINVWRPMKNHAEEWPLAMLDIHSLDYEKDTLAVDHITPITAAEIVLLKYSPNHRWYWMSNQTPEEAILFTSFDSHPPAGNPSFNQVGHAAFRNEAARPDCPPRRSVEMRCIVLDALETPIKSATLSVSREETRKSPWREFMPNPDALVVYCPNFARKADGSVGAYQGRTLEA